LTETLKRLRSEGSTPTETARPPKRPRDCSGPENYKEALTNTKIAISKETYPEDKLTDHNQDSILEELEWVLRRTPIGELPHLSPTDWREVHLYNICTTQQSGQWLIRATDNNGLGSGARLKATDARNLHKPVKVALRTRDKVAQTQDELLSWIKNLNPGLHTKNWRMLGGQSEPKGQRLILHINWDSLVTIQKTGYKIFTGLSKELFWVLKDPELQKEEPAPNIASSESVSEREGDGMPTPSED
jgi:hypothetical protein